MNSINSVIQKFRVGLLKRGFKAGIVDFGRRLKKPGRLILLLPSDGNRRREILKEAAGIPKLFPESEICLVSLPDDAVRETARKEGFRSFAPHQMEMSWYGLPRKPFFIRIQNLKGDMVIDLDDSRNCFNAAVSVSSGAPVRIGLYGLWGPPVHNVEVRSGGSSENSKEFQPLLTLLSSMGIAVSN